MKYLLTGKQMKAADAYTIQEIGIPSPVLMERAAMEVTEKIMQHRPEKQRVLVACGSGNNGGDGYAIARLLHLKGYEVSILFAGNESSRSEENLLQKKICEYYQIPVVEDITNQEYHIIIDAMFGIGLSREVTGRYRDIIEALNRKKAFKVAVDIPSGIQDETGAVMGAAFQADLTVAIAYMKRGEVLQPGNSYAGEVTIVDIGVNDDAIHTEDTVMYTYDHQDLASLVPKRKANSHKGSYGKVGLIVGSKGMSGAAYLCAKATYMMGAGLVRIYTHEANRIILQQLLPEAMITTYESFDKEGLEKFIQWSDVIGIGCGLGQSELSKEILRYTMKQGEKPLVIDADGLNILAEEITLLEGIDRQVVLTPHMKEMARLLNCSVKELQDSRVELLSAFTDQFPVTCVLKDARTLVAKQGESVYLNMTGNASMAKGGSGDVLAGIIAGAIAQLEDGYKAATLGVYLHGLSGDAAKEKRGSYSVLASDIVDAISDVLKQV